MRKNADEILNKLNDEITSPNKIQNNIINLNKNEQKNKIFKEDSKPIINTSI